MTKEEFSEHTAKCLPSLLRTATYRWGDDGEDVIQEALISAYLARDSYDNSCYFSTWVFGYAINIYRNNHRNTLDIDDGVEIDKLADFNTPESYTMEKEVMVLVHMLHPEQRKAMLAKINEELHDRANLWVARKKLAKLLEIE